MLVFILLLTLEGEALAQVAPLDFNDIKNTLDSEIKDDLSIAGNWLGIQTGKYWGFYAASTSLSSGSPMDGLWHFEGGLSGGFNLIYYATSSPTLRQLPADDLGPSLAQPVLPGWLLFTRLSLFDGFDLKVTKVGGIDLGGVFALLPRIDLGKGVEADSLLYGGELRIGIYQDTPTTPGFSFTTTYENISGNLLIKKSYKKDQLKTSVGGNSVTVGGDISGDMTIESTYNLHVIGSKLMVSKKIFFLTPYLGMGTNFNLGTLTMNGKNTLVLKNITVSDPSVTAPAEETLQSSITINPVEPNLYDIRLISGLEANFLQFINVGLEWTTSYNFENHFINFGVKGGF